MTAKEHNRLVGIFLMAHGGMQALVMLILCVVYGAIGIAMMAGGGGRKGEAAFVGVFFIIMVVVLAIVAALFCGSQILGGYKLFKERPNARTWGIIGSIVSCLSFPLGTAAGVYGLWFLFGDLGKQMYLNPGMPQQQMFGQAQQQYDYQQQPPPPNSWQ
ncbi:MAG TPA: hypothetical protein PKA82_10540 [Pyrinomonadaceae bacterium]|nr:hypothetical protein [Pyrinomonadaceae bacterium]